DALAGGLLVKTMPPHQPATQAFRVAIHLYSAHHPVLAAGWNRCQFTEANVVAHPGKPVQCLQLRQRVQAAMQAQVTAGAACAVPGQADAYRAITKLHQSPMQLAEQCPQQLLRSELRVRQQVYVQIVVVAHLSERSEEHTSELQSRENIVCRLLLE